MPRRERITFNGAPGDVWTNDTGRVQYQFICQWQNSCGLCCQFDHAIGPSWPIPMHRSCRCRQLAVYPGQSAQPFVDFREEIRGLDPVQQSKVVGKANLLLVERGVVRWSDVVTAQRVRDLREVVARQRLTVKQMLAAGVPRIDAEEAFGAVNTASHRFGREKRQRMIAGVVAKGVQRDEVKRALGERLATRVGIAAGPGPATRVDVVPSTPAPASKPPPPMPATGPRGPRPTPTPTPKPSPVLPSVYASQRADYLRKAGVKADAIERFVLAATPLERAVAYAESLGIKVVAKGRAAIEAAHGANAANIPALYRGRERAIYINEDNPYWADPDGYMAKAAAARWFSTDVTDHIVLHETAHAIHHRGVGTAAYSAVRQAKLTPDETATALTVSRYGATSPVEFVAETYSGLVAGRAYNSEVMDLYRKFGGPVP